MLLWCCYGFENDVVQELRQAQHNARGSRLPTRGTQMGRSHASMRAKPKMQYFQGIELNLFILKHTKGAILAMRPKDNSASGLEL